MQIEEGNNNKLDWKKIMAKYGNLSITPPDFTQELNALKDLLEKNEITKEEYDKNVKLFQRARLSFLVATNGGYTPSKKGTRAHKISKIKLSELKEQHLAQKTLEYREKLLKTRAETVEPVEENLPDVNNS